MTNYGVSGDGDTDHRRPRSDIQVVARTAELLRMLTTADRIDVDTAAAVLGIGRSSAHRYLSSMERHGFLARRDRNSYEIGSLATQLGAIALGRSGVIRAARPVMEALRDDVRQTIAMALWDGDAAVVAHVVEDTSRTTHVSVRVGSTLNRDTAQSAVFQAFVEQLSFRRAHTVTHSQDEYLKTVRANGVAVREISHEGVRAVAVPVRDPAGAVVATIAAVGVAQLMPDSIDSPVARALTQASADITEAMVHIQGTPATEDISEPE